MLRTFLGLLLVVSFWVPTAWPKEKIKPSPLFMAPEFRFSQIDTICVAAIDLRPDKTKPLYLSESGPKLDFSRLNNADQDLARHFKRIGYQTASCNPPNATLGDLKTPTDTWLRKLDFAESSWLFILAIEDVGTSYHWLGSGGGYAVVSGYLFEKPAAGARLVWRDRAVGIPAFVGPLVGRKSGVEAVESAIAVQNGVYHLLAKFEPRKKLRATGSELIAHEENFDITCNVLWAALKDILKNSGKYDVIGIDDSDMFAIYVVGRSKRIDHLELKSKENRCAMQVFETPPHVPLTNDAGDLAKRIQASLSK